MTLNPYDLMELDKLAATNADQGRHKASDAYHRHALAQAWHGTPAWIEGRTLYPNAWRKHRAAFLAAWQRAAA